MKNLFLILILFVAFGCSQNSSNEWISDEKGSKVELKTVSSDSSDLVINHPEINSDSISAESGKNRIFGANGKAGGSQPHQFEGFEYEKSENANPRTNKPRYLGLHFLEKALDSSHDCSKH